MSDTKRPAEHWSELSSLVDALLDAAPERRPALIDEMSAGDASRRSELEALLAECEREPALFSAPALERFGALFDEETSFPQALLDRYRLARELGRGGMATVYLARDLKHRRDVAVKVVHPMFAAAMGADRFLREIEIVAQLRHPNIVPLFDSGEANGSLYYVMPYETGLSLRHRLANEGALPLEDVLLILRDVCDALAYAHARGIVHRDIKPDNVLLSGRHAMLTDFGIAKASSDPAFRPTSATDAGIRPTITVAGSTIGTPEYMAPEQIAGDPGIDHRADIYAIGMLGYELLTGRLPFSGRSRLEIFAAHMTDSPPSVTQHRPDVPAALAELVMRSLEKLPADRWQSVDEMLRRIETIAATTGAPLVTTKRRWAYALAAAAGFVILVVGAVVAWRGARGLSAWQSRWSKMHIEKLTDFPGSEVDAAISPNGQFVAFLADRDSVFDAFVSQVGSGHFVNLTDGRIPQLFNEDVHNVGFTPDAASVWLRIADINSPASVALVPTMGGRPRPFLNTAVMAMWSPDGSKLVYHETTPGDPIFVAGADGGNPRRIFISTPGFHSHYLSWSPDARFVYFAHGLPPNEMDIWRIAAEGGRAERVTSHNSRVGHPVLVDDRTLLYTATDDNGNGPWLYAMDLETRVATRLSSGVEQFVSVAASAVVPGQSTRLVATVSNPSVQLWSVPLTSAISDEQRASRVSLPTARSAAPRFAADRDSSLLYLASRGGADALWRVTATGAMELWRPDDGAVAGAAAVSPDGRQVCFPVHQRGRSTLRCTSADGSGLRTLAESLDVRGAPSWSPDGKWIATAAREGQTIRIFKVPAEGGPPVGLVDSVSSNPVWSPDGTFILYSEKPRGRSVLMNAVRPDGTRFPLPFPAIMLDRLGDSYRFLPDGKRLVMKLGGFRKQDFWLVDLTTGQRRQLTRLRPGDSVNRFDISPDGKRIVFERVSENSDIAMIEVPAK